MLPIYLVCVCVCMYMYVSCSWKSLRSGLLNISCWRLPTSTCFILLGPRCRCASHHHQSTIQPAHRCHFPHGLSSSSCGSTTSCTTTFGAKLTTFSVSTSARREHATYFLVVDCDPSDADGDRCPSQCACHWNRLRPVSISRMDQKHHRLVYRPEGKT